MLAWMVALGAVYAFARVWRLVRSLVWGSI